MDFPYTTSQKQSSLLQVALKSVFAIVGKSRLISPDLEMGWCCLSTQCKVEKTVMQDKRIDTLMLQLIVFVVQKQVSQQIIVILWWYITY